MAECLVDVLRISSGSCAISGDFLEFVGSRLTLSFVVLPLGVTIYEGIFTGSQSFRNEVLSNLRASLISKRLPSGCRYPQP